ncbi:MAG: hypothetical protein WCQ90_08825 [Deltaproteobacteria bacterium]
MKNSTRKKTNNIVIFEPHIDDALLSCNTRLTSKDYSKIYVVTFSAGDERNSLAYKTRLNRKVIPVILPITEVHYRYSASFNLKDFCEGRKYNQTSYKTIESQFSGYSAVLERICADTGEQYVPYGVYHPHHIITNHLLKNYFHSVFSEAEYIYYYIDQPYCFNHPDHLRNAHERNNIIFYDERIRVEKIPDPDVKGLMLKCFKPFFLTGDEHKINSSLYLKQ